MIYFDPNYSVQEKTKNLLYLLKDATLTEVTCIEELMKKCIESKLFENEVFNTLWRYYTKPNRAWNKSSNALT
jgi:hypothetical protein